jgi:hypothetical protein
MMRVDSCAGDLAGSVPSSCRPIIRAKGPVEVVREATRTHPVVVLHWITRGTGSTEAYVVRVRAICVRALPGKRLVAKRAVVVIPLGTPLRERLLHEDRASEQGLVARESPVVFHCHAYPSRTTDGVPGAVDDASEQGCRRFWGMVTRRECSGRAGDDRVATGVHLATIHDSDSLGRVFSASIGAPGDPSVGARLVGRPLGHQVHQRSTSRRFRFPKGHPVHQRRTGTVPK